MSSQLEAPAQPTPVVRKPKSALVHKRVLRRGQRKLFDIGTVGWVILDIAIGVLAVLVAYLLSPHVTFLDVGDKPHVGLIPCAVTFAVVLVSMAHVAGLHDPRQRGDTVDMAIRCFTVVCLAMATLSIAWNTIAYLQIGRYILVYSTVITILGMACTRAVAWKWTTRFAQIIGFVGSDKFSADVAQFVDDHPLPFRIRTTVDSGELTGEDLADWAFENSVDEVVYDQSSKVNDRGLLACLDSGIKVSSYADFIEENYAFVPVDQIDAQWMFSARLDLAHPYYHGFKRFFDVIASVLGIIISAPAMLVAAILIKLESNGPIFYSQVRIGRFNREFRIYKLRTMVTNAESSGAKWASVNDTRITPVGRFLRKTRLDEIPQFWNVLKGEMSLVGPRPERPEFVETLSDAIPFYVQRHLVNPGVTGWAQINYPYGASVEDSYNKLTYDLYYIKRASIALDLQILLRTVGSVMKGSR